MSKKKAISFLFIFLFASILLYSTDKIISILVDGKKVFDLPVMTLGQKKYVSLNDLVAFFKQEFKGGLINWEPKIGRLELQVDSRKFTLFLNRNVVLIDDFLLDLNASIILVQGEIFIPEDFVYALDYFNDSFETNIEKKENISDVLETEKEKAVPTEVKEPITETQIEKKPEEKFDISKFLEKITLENKVNIVIDPGHSSGSDRGIIVANSESEADITFKIAKRCKEILEQEATYQVVLTREKEDVRNLDDRISIISAIKPQLLISLHISYGPNEKLSGYNIYNYDESVDIEARTFNKDNNPKTKIPFGLNYFNYQEKSDELAQLIEKEFSKSLLKKDNGITKRPLFILKYSSAPSILVEVGYLTNKEEKKLLNSPEYIEKLARAISSAISEFLI